MKATASDMSTEPLPSKSPRRKIPRGSDVNLMEKGVVQGVTDLPFQVTLFLTGWAEPRRPSLYSIAVEISSESSGNVRTR